LRSSSLKGKQFPFILLLSKHERTNKKKVVEVVNLGEAMEGTNVPPAASEDCGGGDALEAINRWLDEPVPQRIFQEDSKMEPRVMQVDSAAAEAAEAAQVEPEATE